MKRSLVLVCLFFLMSVSGCATFHVGLDPVDLSDYQSTGLPLKFSFDHYKPALSFQDKSQWERNLRRSFRESRLFTAVETDRIGRPGLGDPLYIRVRLENNKSPLAYTVGACSGVLSGLTLLLLPGYEQTPYYWQVEVYRQGIKTGEFEYDATTHYVAQWLMLPFMFNNPVDFEGTRITDEFVQTFLAEARAGGVL